MYTFQLLKKPRECAGCATIVRTRLAGHCYQDPMCETCFREVAPDLVEATLALQPVTSIENLKARSTADCTHCGDRLEGRFAGHHRGDPLCVTCFRDQAPDLAALLLLKEGLLEADRAGLLEIRSGTQCAACGNHLEARIAGHRYGDPFCFGCFFPHSPVLATLLRLDEAAREAADSRDSRNFLTVAVSYADLLYRLDADRPRKPPSREGSSTNVVLFPNPGGQHGQRRDS